MALLTIIKTAFYISVWLPPPWTDVLEENSWATIRAAAEAGVASSLWSVGDTKTITLNGTFVGDTLNGEYKARIIGFDHNSGPEEALNTIDFDIVATDDTPIVFAYSEASVMNETDTNEGGWQNSYMRTTILPTFKTCLPSELQSVIIEAMKWTDNYGNGENTSDCVTGTYDEIFLLSEYEIFGEQFESNVNESEDQVQYEIYANGGSTIRYWYDDLTEAAAWWERSAYCVNTNSFCYVDTEGNPNSTVAYDPLGVVPIFRI